MQEKKSNLKTMLHFRFTPLLFVLDGGDFEGNFKKHPIASLYEMAFLPAEEIYVDDAGKYLLHIAEIFLYTLSRTEGLDLLREKVSVVPEDEIVQSLLNRIPFALGMEFVDEVWIKNLWAHLNAEFAFQISTFDGTVAQYFSSKSKTILFPEKIFFHLVENKDDSDFPFAFLATYSTLSSDGAVQHVPLKYALTEFSSDTKKILDLLSCLNKATEASPLLSGFVQSGELFHPLKISAQEAYEFLKAVPEIEKGGIVCRIPNWWKKRQQRIRTSIKLGEKKESLLGLNSIVDMQGFLTLDGMELSPGDIKILLQQTEGLAFIKGRWVEVDHKKLKDLLEKISKLKGKVSLLEALRMQVDSKIANAELDSDETEITNGKWLSSVLTSLKKPAEKPLVPKTLCATLRPYQTEGFEWLTQMLHFSFGACLADDMGLGKTVQVISLLEYIREKNPSAKILLIVPASLLGNWQNECEKFAPTLPFLIFHSSAKKTESESFAFLNITTYSMILKKENLLEQNWDVVILDEAQAIKNPLSKQTKTIKRLQSNFRIAMTGTPIENDLSNLWSIFDFLNKGLLGSQSEFKKFAGSLSEKPEQYAHLRKMISPFMIRRLKTDKSIIQDLPEKNEMIDYAVLSKKQNVLYKKFIDNLKEQLSDADENGIQRKGIVLSSILKLKQLCNHPDQFLGGTSYKESESGKFLLLRQLCETIYEKREKVLVFTQFKEITSVLDDFLFGIFSARGFVLHGGTSVAKRNKMTAAFQTDEYIPYMVLSVKAAGVGLNLTSANHVIHFDRWWNPAVENQATDRAFRIGQTKNVMVHKLVSRGTIEEKIDRLIEDKKTLAKNVISQSSGESWITKLSNDELFDLLKLEA